MKKLLFSLLIFASNYVLVAQNYDNFYDDRDGKSYKAIKIGNQLWMAENLAHKPSSGNYFLYNNEINNLTKYGYLYDWSTACKVCPSGWKLPSNSDYLELTNFLGQDFKQKMMSRSSWSLDESASNISGFSGLPSGMRDHTGTFRYLGLGGYFWTSTFSHQSYAFAREIGKNAGNWASHEFATHQYIGMSVRCIKDQTSDVNNNEIIDDEYTETEFQEPQENVYSESHPIKKGITEYLVFKTQTCNEKQDFNYNYTEEYVCEPVKIESYKIIINIHLDDPMYNEANFKMVNLKTKEVSEFDIEYIEELEDGSLRFVFSVINQPHEFVLNQTYKTIVWFSEWGHWKIKYTFK